MVKSLALCFTRQPSVQMDARRTVIVNAKSALNRSREVVQYEREFGTIKALPRNAAPEVKESFMEEMGKVFEQKFHNETILKQRLSQYKAYKAYYHKKK